jgi:hypothetical protein
VFDLRWDAGLTGGRVRDYLRRRKARFLGRLKSHPVLDALAEPHLKRPPGRPRQGGYETVVGLGWYQAESWDFPPRVLLVILDQPDPKTGQLFLEPDYFFLVAGGPEEEWDGPGCLEHYRRRGTFEDRRGEFKQAVGMPLSRPEFRENEASLLLGLLAFNLADLLWIEWEDALGGCWHLGRFRDYVLKAGGGVAKRARRLIVHLTQALVGFWQRLLERITAWRLAPRFPLPRGPTVRAWRQAPRPRICRRYFRTESLLITLPSTKTQPTWGKRAVWHFRRLQRAFDFRANGVNERE